MTKLIIKIPIDNSLRHVASRLARIYESFKNLRSLNLQVVLANSKELYSSDQNWPDLLPDSLHMPPKLTTLTLNVSEIHPYSYLPDPQLILIFFLTTRFLYVFRHVQNLTLIDMPGWLIQRPLNLLHVTSISFLRTPRTDKILGEFFKFTTPLAQNLVP